VNVNEAVVMALSEFGDPVVAAEFIQPQAEKKPDRYYEFSASTYGVNFANDEPTHEAALVHVHLHCPKDYDVCERISLTKKALFDNGFTWPEAINASDKDGQHIVFDCRFLKGVSD